ncbi:hypothetical protein WI85_26430 [Burkholderia ubonensis]|nr:hypothetical protein WI85_26430 [Burkholderia ubonensis]
MPYSPLQSIRRYQSISMFGGGILVTVLVLIACALGMASIVYEHIEAGRRNFVSGKEETLDEIKTSETSFRNGVANTQLIWREISRAPDSVVEAFFGNEQRIAIKPYPSLVVGVPGQTGSRAEVSRYLALSILLSCICAARSINRGRLLEGYHYSTRAGVFGLVPTMDEDRPALATPERRARVLDALRIDFGDERPPAAGERPRVRWLPPSVPSRGKSGSGSPRRRIRMARRLRSSWPNMRRYALAGVRGILTKPVTLAHLHGALAHARRRRDLRGQRLRMGGAGRDGRTRNRRCMTKNPQCTIVEAMHEITKAECRFASSGIFQINQGGEGRAPRGEGIRTAARFRDAL